MVQVQQAEMLDQLALMEILELLVIQEIKAQLVQMAQAQTQVH
jgi:hypothetical protein